MVRALTTFLLAFAFISVCSPARAAEPGAVAEVSAAVMVVGEGSPITLDQATLGFLSLLTELRAGGLAKPDQCTVRLKFLPGSGEKAAAGVLEVRYPSAGDPEKYLSLATKCLEGALLEMHRATAGHLARRCELAERRKAEAEHLAGAYLEELQSLRKKATQQGAFPDSMDDQFAKLKEERLSYRVEIAGLSAQHEAVMEQIKACHERLQAEESAHQAVLKELERIVSLREQQTTQVRRMVAAGVAQAPEPIRAEVDLAMSRADLAKHRQLALQESRSEPLRQLNQQLADVQIQLAAAEARVRVIDRTLAELDSDELRKLVDDCRRAEHRWKRALQAEEQADAEFAEIRARHDAIALPRLVLFRRDQPGNQPPDSD